MLKAMRRQTLLDHVFDGLLLLAFALGPCILFDELWENQGLHSFNDTSESRIARLQQPSLLIGRILQKYATFENRVLADSKISPYRSHV